MDTVQGLIDGSTVLDGLSIDADLRWQLVESLAAGGRIDADGVAKELSADNTQNGQLAAASAKAAIPTASAKAETWAAVVENSEGANAVQRAAIAGFTNVWDTALLEPYVEKYFAAIRGIWQDRSYETASTIVQGLYPSQLVSESTIASTDTFLSELGDDLPALRRLVVESRDGVVRALAAQRADV